MSGDLITLDVRTRVDWRQWLATHHASSPGIWLIRHKQHSGVAPHPPIPQLPAYVAKALKTNLKAWHHS